jgi:hypothetical protein
MRILARALLALPLVLLAACGGGTVSVVWSSGVPVISQFIVWEGNSLGDQIVDASGQRFAFLADSGCLYNFQTRRENTAFCLIAGGNVAAYGSFRGAVVNVRSSSGSCVAALLDALTGNFTDIRVDAYDREVVATTQLRPERCANSL